ncbi:DUF948 domain-containing protein [Thermoactinomyces sp. DSM 45892]|uniref:DUF948 domain-containing protein n=1 Tax=Thermoactinomyces sp. DSM 45892 TaxID=1882753 RepID=UPI00089A7696|nr:DUF948 domain-containing protein [Thermoactinomyces sp. DSM 45892]SDY26857.1 Uncharacterized protein YoxC, contains an MCP-like domain [Thermoactinomyces sp. DSM 45892]
MIYQICAGIATFSFLLLVIYIIRTLITMNRTLRSASSSLEEATLSLQTIQKTIQDLQPQVQSVLSETEKALHVTNELVADVRHKAAQTQEVFDTIQNLGKSIDRVSHTIVESVQTHRGTIGNAVSYMGLGLELIRKWKDRNQS